jgi:hypothetical protein
MPEVQGEIKQLENSRNANEVRYMSELEKAFNEELINASKQIKVVISEALKVFEDPNLFDRSVEYALFPPIDK